MNSSLAIKADLAVAEKVKYVSRQPDQNGYIHYSDEEHCTWATLYNRQTEIIKGRACDEFIAGIDLLQMSADQIPQLPDINRKLKKLTGWQVENVPALIGFERFFELLANKRFPAATFIRTKADIDYIQEPDIFHELFGHCPLLTNQAYADFSQHYGELGLKADKADRPMLARLYWFTIEFGLMQTQQGLKIFGGGILSSKQETCYSLESDIPNRQPLQVIEAFRTHYRIDELQKNYFVINQLTDLQQLVKLDLITLIKEAKILGMKPSAHTPKEDKAC
ncbi:phenylalanine 4-monooxygenase [Moritella marina ATCC 15381]|uniref:Phenylalanine-4-hydroxylase n=1 Tax=Moritella marina ATCC 15381 TaxID=1202962 RepID=A0A5J6WEV6_MORMI|nr:phenylalanine 4-monooxygenase [Moritella marina]QFI36473.1 phenylalanine 4-monooxygenase [Moritella marina ATCC 15381]